MNVHIFSTYDGILDFRTDEFLFCNPHFWATNGHMIDEVWKVDTDNMSKMKDVLTQWKNRQIKNDSVEEVCSRLGFDLIKFKSQFKDERQPLFQYNNS